MVKDQDASPLTRPGGSGNARRRWRPTAAGALLPAVLDRATRRAGFADARLLADWPTIVGPEVAAVSLPLRLDRRTRCLVLLVRPTAALLLQHQEPQLLERINTVFGSTVAWRLQLVQGPLPAPRTRPEPAPVDPAEAARIAESVAGVAAPELRAALLDLGLAMASRRAERP